MTESDERQSSTPSDIPRDPRLERHLEERRFEQRSHRREAKVAWTQGIIVLAMTPLVFLLSWAISTVAGVGGSESLIGAAGMVAMFAIAGLGVMLLAKWTRP